MTTTVIRSFRIEIPQADLDDLHARLDATRWPRELPGGEGWDRGAPLDYLRRLAGHWRDMDWRAMERRLNAFPQFVTTIEGLDVHFLHVRSADPDALPLLLTHGWPNSFLEFVEEIAYLTERFHVVIPSVPGFGFSQAPTSTDFTVADVARMWTILMDRLGYERYGVQGGDLGAYIAPETAKAAPDRVVGVHLDGGLGMPTEADVPSMGPEELAEWEEMQVWMSMGINHHEMLGRGPQSFAAGWNDSPVGLLGWLIQKFKEFTISAEYPDEVIDVDLLVANVALYWFTGSAGTSSWPFQAAVTTGTLPWPEGQSAVPTGVYGGGSEAMRKRAALTSDIVHWPEDNAFSGHFIAMEQPVAHAADIAAFFAKLA